MARLNAKFRSIATNLGPGLSFWCPGCNERHVVTTEGPHAWKFNGNLDAPTFSPSLNVTGTKRPTDDEHRRIIAGEKLVMPAMICHTFITDGQIQFLGDCTHALKGQTVPLPDMPHNE